MPSFLDIIAITPPDVVSPLRLMPAVADFRGLLLPCRRDDCYARDYMLKHLLLFLLIRHTRRMPRAFRRAMITRRADGAFFFRLRLRHTPVASAPLGDTRIARGVHAIRRCRS